jgi:hypothetical protein
MKGCSSLEVAPRKTGMCVIQMITNTSLDIVEEVMHKNVNMGVDDADSQWVRTMDNTCVDWCSFWVSWRRWACQRGIGQVRTDDVNRGYGHNQVLLIVVGIAAVTRGIMVTAEWKKETSQCSGISE